MHIFTIAVCNTLNFSQNSIRAKEESTKGWLITDSGGEVATEGSFYAKTVVVEGHRINEVGMWRVTKTVTIKVLYVNGQKASDKNGVVGIENFEAVF